MGFGGRGGAVGGAGGGGGGGRGRKGRTLRASLSGTFLQTARFSYATEGALFISAQLSSDVVSALRKVPVII